MLSNESSKSASCMGQPMTHRDCLARLAHPSGRPGCNRLRVQLLRYHPDGSVPLCGQVVALSNAEGTGAELFKVETAIGPFWTLGKNVRACSGDGRCTCEPAPDQHAEAPRGSADV